MATHQRKPNTGTKRKLVIAIDVGTTFSGVSYALIDPGMVPQIKPVTKFLGQREPRRDSKVPSIVCYNPDGTLFAVGAETDPETNPALAERDDIIQVEWFKLHLRPPHLEHSQQFEIRKLRSLPKNKTPVQVLTDFLKYLFQSTMKYIRESEPWSWKSVEKNIHFVFSHPNGWEGKHQTQIRDAAIAGNLIYKSLAMERILFVSEGEASLHFCLNKDSGLHNERDGIIVVDCGGGTIDASAYLRTPQGKFKEITAPECLYQGSVFVTHRAQEYLGQKLRNSVFGSQNDIEDMVRKFDRVTKCMFHDPETPCYIKFGGWRDNDLECDIRSGSIKIAGKEMADFFGPSIQRIIAVIQSQLSNKSTATIKTVLLVGGFARSEYLFSQLTSSFTSVKIRRVDVNNLNKAAADGAVSYYLDHYVTERVSKYSYGLKTDPVFDPTNPGHARRKATKFISADGKYYVPGAFSIILKKYTTVSEETKFRKSYIVLIPPEEFPQWRECITRIRCYRGSAENPPEWIDLEPDSFHDACRVKVDVTNIKENLSAEYDPDAKKYYHRFDHDVEILFGLTELKAYVIWKEDGIEKRSDAIIVYDN